MHILGKLGILVTVLAGATWVATYPIEQSYAAKSAKVQLITKDASADLFGDAGTPVGSPQEMIIEDPKAFVEGSAPEGVRLVSDNYLKEKGIYPLQMKTVRFTLEYVRYGAWAGLVVGVLLWIVGRPRRSSQS